MEEESKKTDDKKKKWWIWPLIVVFILIVGVVWLYARSGNESTDSNSSTTNTSNKSSDSVKSACNKEPEIKSSRHIPTGPVSHSIYSASSTDGINWEADGKLIYNEASVPGAVIHEGIIYLYFVDASGNEDQLSVAISDDLGLTYTKSKVNIEGMASYNAVDPHPEVINNKISIYYLGDFMCMNNESQEQKFRFYSSSSSDGINFDNQTLNYTFNEPTTDPDVFMVGDEYRMLTTSERRMNLLSSIDGHKFSIIEDFSWSNGGVSDTFNFDGKYRTFYCDQGISYGDGVENGVISPLGIAYDPKTGDVVCDPSIIQLPDKSFRMYYKTQKQSSNNTTSPPPPPQM